MPIGVLSSYLFYALNFSALFHKCLYKSYQQDVDKCG